MGMLGAALLFVGMFLPVFSMPTIDDITYFQNGRFDRIIVLSASVFAMYFALARNSKGLVATGAMSLVFAGYSFIDMYLQVRDMKESIRTESVNYEFEGSIDTILNTIELQWGWYVIAAGVLLILLAGFVSDKAKHSKKRA